MADPCCKRRCKTEGAASLLPFFWDSTVITFINIPQRPNVIFPPGAYNEVRWTRRLVNKSYRRALRRGVVRLQESGRGRAMDTETHRWEQFSPDPRSVPLDCLQAHPSSFGRTEIAKPTNPNHASQHKACIHIFPSLIKGHQSKLRLINKHT